MRQGWQRFLAENDKGDHDRAAFELTELFNIVELACAIYYDSSFSGNVHRIVRQYLTNFMSFTDMNERFQEVFQASIDTPDTYEFIRRFRDEMERGPSGWPSRQEVALHLARQSPLYRRATGTSRPALLGSMEEIRLATSSLARHLWTTATGSTGIQGGLVLAVLVVACALAGVAVGILVERNL